MVFRYQATPRSYGSDAKSRPTRFTFKPFETWDHVSQPSLASFYWLGHYSILARVTNVNPSHSAMLMVSSSKLRTPTFTRGGPTLLNLHSGLIAQSVTNDVRWTSMDGSPTLSWSLHCRSNTTTTRAILGNYVFTLGQCPWRPYRLALGGWSHTTSPI